MPTKETIIDNVGQYSAQELVGYIQSGAVTYDELCEEPDFSAKDRQEVLRLLDGSENEDWQRAVAANTQESYAAFLNAHPDSIHAAEAYAAIESLQPQPPTPQSDWDAVDKEDINSLQYYIDTHTSDDPYIGEARRIINDLRREEFLGFDLQTFVQQINNINADRTIIDPDLEVYEQTTKYLKNGKVSHEDLLGLISRDNNFLSSSTLRSLIDNGYITWDDLSNASIAMPFIKALAKNVPLQHFVRPVPLDRINKVSTEVYFWGIPSSGKSCALGAIMSVANNGKVARSMDKDNDCQGYDYMTRLSRLFQNNGEVGALPASTDIYSTYEMGFDLEDKDKKVHPITCIDLAGELMLCMYKQDAGEDLSDDEVQSLDTLTRVLSDNRTGNRKIHFFVIEYGGENRLYNNLDQRDYLEAALRYIQRTGIFKKDTDAVYLVVTKADKTGMDLTDPNIGPELSRYVDENYSSFYNGLERICRDCGINGGRVERVPFTLGQVCFKYYCLFDERSAANVVSKLLSRSKGFKHGKITKLSNLFKK